MKQIALVKDSLHFEVVSFKSHWMTMLMTTFCCDLWCQMNFTSWGNLLVICFHLCGLQCQMRLKWHITAVKCQYNNTNKCNMKIIWSIRHCIHITSIKLRIDTIWWVHYLSLKGIHNFRVKNFFFKLQRPH